MKLGYIVHPCIECNEPFTIKCDETKFEARMTYQEPKIFDSFEDAYIFLRVKCHADHVESSIQKVPASLRRKVNKILNK